LSTQRMLNLYHIVLRNTFITNLIPSVITTHRSSSAYKA
jgi:hypothetical protein